MVGRCLRTKRSVGAEEWSKTTCGRKREGNKMVWEAGRVNRGVLGD